MDRYLRKALTTINTNIDTNTLDSTTRNVTDIEAISCNSSESNNSSEENITCSTKKKRKYNHIFNKEWTKQFTWLKNILPDSKLGMAFCILCNKRLSGNIFHIKHHENSYIHKKNVNAVKVTQSVASSLMSKKVISMQEKECELKMVAFITEHNLPISIMDHLPGFIKSVCPDSNLITNIYCGRTKTSLILRDIFRKENLTELAEQMKQNYFSLIIDETTDIGTQKSLVICVRFVYDSSIKDHFLTLIELENSSAKHITNIIIEFLNSIEVPLQNMIGFAADNAAVMMGNINGVQAQLKESVPHLFVLGCTCHSFHLCCSVACKQLPRAIEQFARDIYNFFSNSSKRYSELKELQTFLNIRPNKLLRPSQTRWLSLSLVVEKILINWEALKLYFHHTVLIDKLPSTENIFTTLINPVYKLFFFS